MFIPYDEDYFVDTNNGILVNKKNILNAIKKDALQRQGMSPDSPVEYDVVLDSKTLELFLADSNIADQNRNGFLIEVFEENQEDGSLVKLNKNPSYSIDNENITTECYSDYITIEVE